MHELPISNRDIVVFEISFGWEKNELAKTDNHHMDVSEVLLNGGHAGHGRVIEQKNMRCLYRLNLTSIIMYVAPNIPSISEIHGVAL
jgi:hypothetical protein